MMFSQAVLFLSLVLGDPAAPPQSTLPPAPPQSTLPLVAVDHHEKSHGEKSVTEKVWEDSLQTGKPIIMWIGGNFCERCVNDSINEFHHVFLSEWQGMKGPATVVVAPHEGTIYRVATINRWTVGSSDWGHIPSARRVLNEWRQQVRSGSTAPLKLLHMSGGEWGMSHNMFWSNYRGNGSSNRSAFGTRSARSVSGNC